MPTPTCGQFRNDKIIYRRYAGLFFCLCVDNNDNELGYLEAIHLFVEVLDAFFQNVCELDLVFSFYKVSVGRYVVPPWHHLEWHGMAWREEERQEFVFRTRADSPGRMNRCMRSSMKCSSREKSKRRARTSSS